MKRELLHAFFLHNNNFGVCFIPNDDMGPSIFLKANVTNGAGRSDGSVTMRGVRHTGPILLNWRQPNNQATAGKAVEIWMW